MTTPPTSSPLTARKDGSSVRHDATDAAGGEGAGILVGDCRDLMSAMEPDSIDALVGDPPYGLKFMGKAWDHGVPGVEFWTAALRVAKPGAHLLMAGGTRTYHRLACAIEDAGWEIRDCISWVYGSGFPKSLNISKAIDAAAGAERPVVGVKQENAHDIRNGQGRAYGSGMYAGELTPRLRILETAAATPEAAAWDGWGTALKPAVEPFILARKPLGMTVAACCLKHGTGGINVEGCGVGDDGGTTKGSAPTGIGNGIYGAGIHGSCEIVRLDAGRFPSNFLHDGSDEVLALLGESARFFYCAKPSRRERDAGLGELEAVTRNRVNAGGLENDPKWAPQQRANNHPTVKPIHLMRYLVRLVTRPGALVLDPFAGSGTTGCACALEGRRFVGCELDERYAEIARARVAYWAGVGVDDEAHAPEQLKLFGDAR